MTLLSINAWDAETYLSLAEILLVRGRIVLPLQWDLHVWEVAPGPGVETIDALDPSVSLNTFELLHLVTPCVQIIDGVIEGYDSKGALVVLIRAVDSTSWDVETDVMELIQTLKDAYPEASSVVEDGAR